jgi:serine protease inhibitor
MDLIEGVERLGVRVSEIDGIRHGAGVSMDEEGAKASAFTVDSISGLLPPDEIVFALDRPFMFIITGIDGLPLFVGIVNQP